MMVTTTGTRLGAAGLVLAILGSLGPVFAPAFAQAEPEPSALQAEKPFLDENASAMDRMMAGIDVKPTGNVDRDFVAMMRPHHQGAIDMAQAYLRYGQNVQLRRVAQEIIVEQQQEIAAMALALGDPLPPSSAAPTTITPGDATATATATGSAHHHHPATSNTVRP